MIPFVAEAYRVLGKTCLAAILILLYATRWPATTVWLQHHPLMLVVLILAAMALFTIQDALDLLWGIQFSRENDGVP